MRLVPLGIMLSFYVLAFSLFLIWPINWPIYGPGAWLRLTSYVALCLAALAFAFVAATRRTEVVREPFRFGPAVILAGTLLAVVLLVPSSKVYADRYPWQILEALENQGETYFQFQQALVFTEGRRALIAFVRAVASPLTFAVVPLGIILWTRLSLPLRVSVLLAAGTSIIFSIMRGTDKEFGDLFVVIISAFLINAVRSGQGLTFGRLIGRQWKKIVFLLVFFAIAASLFVNRKSERTGGYETLQSVCAVSSNICADTNYDGIAWLPEAARFGVSTFVIYVSQGFYGLNLSLEKDFKPAWGLGHSRAFMSVYEQFTGDYKMETRTYTYRNGIQGWNGDNFWVTIMPWLANDVGFPGAVVVLAGLGYAWGRSWRAATLGRSDPAAVVFCQLMVVMLYFTANNQVFAAFDGYFVLGTWTVLWLGQRKIGLAPRLGPARG